MSKSTNNSAINAKPDLDALGISGHARRRTVTDFIVRHFVTLGGIGTIIAISIIFAYLFYVVVPLFAEPELSKAQQASIAESDKAVHFAIEETHQLVMVVYRNGEVAFINLNDGKTALREDLGLDESVSITAVEESASGIIALANSNGVVQFIKPAYSVSFDTNNTRQVIPELQYPYGEEPIALSQTNRAIADVSFANDEEYIAVAALDNKGDITVARYLQQVSFIDDSVVLEEESIETLSGNEDTYGIVLEPTLNWLISTDAQGNTQLHDLYSLSTTVATAAVLPSDEEVTSFKLLNGGSSVLVGSSSGSVAQWMLVRDDNNDTALQLVRSFAGTTPVRDIITEKSRKGFIAVYDNGVVSVFHTTSERHLTSLNTDIDSAQRWVLAPRADLLMGVANKQASLWHLDNPHPEISLTSLLGKVWYEGYQDEQFLWQSTAATGDFEPKYSLTPLLFGTMKAAFYALLFAIPLSIAAAVYTAYFMKPRLRQVVKPSIEVMEAIPTVILGFLAGLWLAPLVEQNLPGVFAIVLLLPLSFLLLSFVGYFFREKLHIHMDDGWQFLVMIPVVVFIGYISFEISPWLERSFFGGDMRHYVAEQWGLTFDQRNALVVGIAMGFAVIPTIFSIAEDALFSVPKHLTQGALALGATPWQTLVRVVMPTASPAIFSAVMMGLGRAVGETMIILMATGNTPIMDMNIFEGMRTLSANIAVEMPESSVGSTHYRVLFLTALLLFIGTFIFNTLAETVRHRLRKKYSRF